MIVLRPIDRHPSLMIDQEVADALARHPAVRDVELVGSRAEGRATTHSDWDFVLHVEDFGVLAGQLPDLCAPLNPVAQQWDRLSTHYCWMLTLHGPVKVDLIFPQEPHQPEPPWKPTGENLSGIDLHFWDWVLWLAGKEAGGKRDLIAPELQKLFQHILRPLGVRTAPASLAAAVSAYQEARAAAERRFGMHVSRALETAVMPALRQ